MQHSEVRKCDNCARASQTIPDFRIRKPFLSDSNLHAGFLRRGKSASVESGPGRHRPGGQARLGDEVAEEREAHALCTDRVALPASNQVRQALVARYRLLQANRSDRIHDEDCACYPGNVGTVRSSSALDIGWPRIHVVLKPRHDGELEAFEHRQPFLASPCDFHHLCDNSDPCHAHAHEVSVTRQSVR